MNTKCHFEQCGNLIKYHRDTCWECYAKIAKEILALRKEYEVFHRTEMIGKYFNLYPRQLA